MNDLLLLLFYTVAVQCSFITRVITSAVSNANAYTNANNGKMIRSLSNFSRHFIDVPDNFGTAPLMSACRLGRTE